MRVFFLKYARQGLTQAALGLFYVVRFAVLLFAPPALCLRYSAALKEGVLFFWGLFSWFVLLSLLVSVVLACPLVFGVLLVWRWLVVAVPGLCALLLARSLARLSGRCSCLVLLLLPLLWLVLGLSALLWRFVLAFALSLAWCGWFLSLLCASSSLAGFCPSFF